MIISGQSVRRLGFEGKYLLESIPCVTCGGTGQPMRASSRGPRSCWNCHGLGRRITARGREVWREICRELGKPVGGKESRIDPKWLDTIFAQYVTVDMCVGAIYPVRKPPKQVTAVEELGIQLRLTFEGRSQAVFSTHDVLHREFSDAELEAVDLLMKSRLGQGSELLVEAGGRTICCWPEASPGSDERWWIAEIDGEEREIAPVGDGDDQASLQRRLHEVLTETAPPPA